MRLTAYSYNENKLKELGISLKPVDGDWIAYKESNNNGIASICMRVGDGSIQYLQSCENQKALDEPKVAAVTVTNEESKIVTESKIKKKDNFDNSLPLVKPVKNLKQERAISMVKVSEEKEGLSSRQAEKSPVNDNQKNERQKELEILREQANLAQSERKTSENEARLKKVKDQTERLQQIKDVMVADTDSLKREKSTGKAALKDLQIEVNRSRRERQALASNNKRQQVKRDSLLAQQVRLEQELIEQQARLEQAKLLREENERLIKQQQELIEEQGLKSETAESLKAYRTALLGEENGDELLAQGYLMFALEQCFYKVYNGYSIVYGNQGNFLFTINQELREKPSTGELKIKGKPFVYTYSRNLLYIKDTDGNLVNEHGEILSTVNKF